MAEFGTLNWAVVIVYIIGNLLLGFILSKRVETADHFSWAGAQRPGGPSAFP